MINQKLGQASQIKDHNFELENDLWALGFMVCTSFEFKSSQILHTLSKSYVNSILCFGSVVQNPSYQSYIGQLGGIQNKFINVVNKKCFPQINNNNTTVRNDKFN